MHIHIHVHIRTHIRMHNVQPNSSILNRTHLQPDPRTGRNSQGCCGMARKNVSVGGAPSYRVLLVAVEEMKQNTLSFCHTPVNVEEDDAALSSVAGGSPTPTGCAASGS